jgi:hypothetical protein
MLPAGAVKDKLGQCLKTVRENLESGNGNPVLGNEKGINPKCHPLDVLRHHIMFGELVYRTLRLGYALAWLGSFIIWGVITVIFLICSKSHNLLVFPTAEIAHIWVLIFSAGVLGSAIAGLWKIYTQTFELPLEFCFLPQEHLEWIKYPKVGWCTRFRLVRGEFIRALVRPLVGGFFAWIVILLLLAGHLSEQLADAVANGGAIKENSTAVVIAVVAGFSEGWVISLLEKARSNAQQ